MKNGCFSEEAKERKMLVVKRMYVCVVMKCLTAFECQKVFILKETKTNDKWALNITFKTLLSLTTSYYPRAQKPSVRKPFRFMTHRQTSV